MKYVCGLYLAANKARHLNHHIIYQDIDPQFKCDMDGDMLKYMDADITQYYTYIIATPPCNWWSKANPYYWRSEYALKTRHLLPLTLIKLAQQKKPFIVECVKNIKRYKENHIFKICEMYSINYQIVGRHIYFSNTNIDVSCPQIQDFKYGGRRVNNDKYNQGGTNVHNCIEIFINEIERRAYED